MRNPEPFDPLQLGRYAVFRVHYEYTGQCAEEKLFILLQHTRETKGMACWCIKATSQLAFYERDQAKMDGVVLYEAGVLTFFPKRTIIDPASLLQIWHSQLLKQAQHGKYRIEGKMPADFHGKFCTAARRSILLEPKRLRQLLACVGET